jgi:hypothetical protein
MMKRSDLIINLARLSYPAYVVAYGPERSGRTLYRGEHPGTFNAELAHSPEEALAVIDNAKYFGHLGEMSLYAVCIEDGQLVEKNLKDTPPPQFQVL